mgnify:CR=1 FL=1
MMQCIQALRIVSSKIRNCAPKRGRAEPASEAVFDVKRGVVTERAAILRIFVLFRF